MDARDLGRYKRLLLERQRELTAAKAEAMAPLPGASREISLTKPMPMPKRSFRSFCIKPMGGSRGRLTMHSRGYEPGHSASVKPASYRFPELVWRRCRGRTFAENVRSVNALEPLNREA